jgi:hypothetical protein
VRKGNQLFWIVLKILHISQNHSLEPTITSLETRLDFHHEQDQPFCYSKAARIKTVDSGVVFGLQDTRWLTG